MNFMKRIALLREKLAEKGADGIIINSSQNLFYMTGMYVHEFGLLLITKDKIVLLTNFIYTQYV